MNRTEHNERWHYALEMICYSSASQILEGISFSEFRA